MKISIKHWIKTLVCASFILSNTLLFAQVDSFIISVQNLTQTASNKLEFDVYLLDTDASQPMELAFCQLGFLFNSSIYSGGTISAEIDNTNSGLKPTQQFSVNPNLLTGLSGYPGMTRLALAGRWSSGGSGDGTIISTSGNGTLLTHFILTSSVNFPPNSTFDLVFSSSSVPRPLYATSISVYKNNFVSELPVIPGVNAFVNGNPPLNPPPPIPSAFNVTGTGSYCEGGPGLQIGLDNSEISVTYTLYKNGLAQTPVVQGTGSALSFGNQLAGTYTITGSNSSGSTVMNGSAVIVENPVPSAPLIGTITQPTCHTATGSVDLSDLPAGGWTLSSNLGGIISSGNGTSTTVSGLEPGSYTFTVTSTAGCTSVPSGDVLINDQPPTPTAPVVGTITQPTCNVSTGSVELSGLPDSGDWIITRNPGNVTTTGNGSGTTILNIPAGTYTFTVSNEYTCVSQASEKVVINTQPPTPLAPLKGTITPPSCEVPVGSVILNGLPSGTWKLMRYPGPVITEGTGSSITIFNLNPGTYNFSVENEYSCTSGMSESVDIPPQPVTPTPPVIGTVIQPSCDVSTGSVQLTGLPAGKWTIVSTPETSEIVGDGSSTLLTDIPSGRYTFTVINEDMCKSLPSDEVVILPQPPTPSAPVVGPVSQPTCTLPTGSVNLRALPATGEWILTRSPGNVTYRGNGASMTISDLRPGSYTFTVTNDASCTSDPSDTVLINQQPPSPPAPEHEVDCRLGFDQAIITVTRPVGPDYRYSLDNGSYQSNNVFTGVSNGSHRITVRNNHGCTTTGDAFDVSCACVDPPVLILSRTEGSTCGIAAVTVDDNRFGGSATRVSITSNGAGIVSPSFSVNPRFSFSYTPSPFDVGRTVIITVTTDNPLGLPCTPAIATYRLRVHPIPAAPVPDDIKPPTCDVSTGSVVLTGLPSPGHWTIFWGSEGASRTGSGTTTTISDLVPGRYTFIVRSEEGCSSRPSVEVIIPLQPPTPTPPIVGIITPPSCAVNTGSVTLNGLPEGRWILTRYPDSFPIEGRGGSATVSGLISGTYNFSVTNSDSCTSALSADVIIPEAPPVPSPPVPGRITQPTCEVFTGSVELSGLPAGSWKLAMRPGTDSIIGNTTRYVVTGLAPESYTFTVTNSFGCTSDTSSVIVITPPPPRPSPPVVGTITHPTCILATGSVNLRDLPENGEWILTRSPGNVETRGRGSSTTISGLNPGYYTFTVTNSFGCTSFPSSPVEIKPQPPSPQAPVHNIDCSQGFGNAVVTVTSPLGTGLEYRLDSGPFQSSPVFTGVANGNHRITVRNAFDCRTTGPEFSVNCGCVNPPTVLLSSYSGSTCGTRPVTVSNNIFGGSATRVTITRTGGTGIVSPSFSDSSNFEFTYIPASSDAGRTIVITVTTNNPLGAPCAAASAIYTLTVNANPGAPVIGQRTHPTCTVATGSVILSGLPSTGTWTLIRNPGAIETQGTGPGTTVSNLLPGRYTFAIRNAEGCTSGPSAYVEINNQPPIPAAPVLRDIIQPDCFTSTGSVTLTGLPASGAWTVIRHPDSVPITGIGTSFLLQGIPTGNFTFTVRNSYGCESERSEELRIDPQPITPPPPSVGRITAPTCTDPTGSVTLMGLPSYGDWILIRYPGSDSIKGTGTSYTVSSLPSGTYNFAVRNSFGCVSIPSVTVRIPEQPPIPAAPIIGTITQPTYDVPTGSVVLRGLPAGNWVLTRYPGNITRNGSGSSVTIDHLPAGVFTFTVTNSFGCVSEHSNEVTISTPGIPELIITDPDPVCTPSTVDITRPEVTHGSTAGLIYTYWLDPDAERMFTEPQNATAGIYYIKGTTVSGFFDIKPVRVRVYDPPVVDPGPDQILDFTFSITMNATLLEYERGFWTSLTGNPVIENEEDPKTLVSQLSQGDNFFMWTVTNDACEPADAIVKIEVGDLILPTIITPNYDGKNDYFVLKGLEILGKTELLIFDRRGLQVYKNSDYNNDWDGVDHNNQPLPEDTYFYIIKSANGKTMSGYVVIRR